MTEAKNEVMERKKDLDLTKEKMDKLVDKLYLGRQACKKFDSFASVKSSQGHHKTAYMYGLDSN